MPLSPNLVLVGRRVGGPGTAVEEIALQLQRVDGKQSVRDGRVPVAGFCFTGDVADTCTQICAYLMFRCMRMGGLFLEIVAS